MTRNNHKKSDQTPSPLSVPTEDNIINLPDLSAFQEAEKQHILKVLVRDENLRDKHLARFMHLRKEVADLEQQSQTTATTSECARCHTPFGYIFNTGDACPKCAAKVCKQCRLMYNVNDNGWLCQLCCKHMQLMSYSGEWIYSIHSNLRKNSTTQSESLNESVPPSTSAQNANVQSSSDSEQEDLVPAANKNDRFSTKSLSSQPTKPTKPTPKDPINSMIVQTSTDEKKLNFIKGRMKDRPLNASFTQPLPRRTRQIVSPSTTINSSSDDTNSLLNQSNTRQGQTLNKQNPRIPKSEEELKPNQNAIDLGSLTSSELGTGGEDDNNKSEKDKLKVKQQPQSTTHDSKLSLSSITTAKSHRKTLSASMQSLRDAVHRIPHPHLSSSRISVNSEKNNKTRISNSSTLNDETISLKVPDISSRSNSRIKLTTPQTSVDESKQTSSKFDRLDSTNTTNSQPVQRNVSFTDSEYNHQDSRENRPESLGNRESIPDSEDDIDNKFEKAKSGSTKRASSFMDIRGSQLSVNSTISETKARYDLDISGTIEIKLSYNMNTGSLDIFIKKCTNLARTKRQQTPNPYCKIYLLPDRSKGSKRKTAVIKGTTEPVFNETLRYHLSIQDFDLRILWVSVWSQPLLGNNDFLGEVNIPLANCTLDVLEEHTLLSRIQQENLTPNIEPAVEQSELYFELTFIEHPKNKEIGTIQINSIHAKGIYYGKHNVDAICKGLLMPDKVKRKLPTTRKGPSPKWDIPLRWENIRRDNLKNISIEISIWNQEHFRKTMINFIRLNSSRGHLDKRTVKLLNATEAEKAVWELFQQKPTKIHSCRLPLRPAIIEQK